MYKQLILLGFVFTVVLADIELHDLQEKPSKYEGVDCCYIKALKDCIPQNILVPSKKECMAYRCYKNHYSIETCGEIEMGLKTSAGDLSKPYPHCCPVVHAEL
nr:venom protein U-MPTX.1-Mc18 [Megalopyge crispata]